MKVPLEVRVFQAIPDDAPEIANPVELEIESADLDQDILWVYVKGPASE